MNNTQDHAAREQAIDPSQSFIVQAPAGSGKTELITQRYLALLANSQGEPEQIIALTFTNKAVNEMRTRIVNALTIAAQDAPCKSPHQENTKQLAMKVLKQDKKYNWCLLENPNRLRIQTIDAFCCRLTKQLPLMSGFGANANITEDPTPQYKKAISLLFKDITIFGLDYRDALLKILYIFVLERIQCFKNMK